MSMTVPYILQGGFMIPGLTMPTAAVSLAQPATPVKLHTSPLATSALQTQPLVISTSAQSQQINAMVVSKLDSSTSSSDTVSTDITTSGLPPLLAPVSSILS